jgi:RHS repeat-associated protein
MFRDSSGIAKPTQVENFGIWGESLTGINYYKNTTNKQNFVYTGHEKLEELGVFDAKARVYDPITPRFWQQDILADKFRKYSPYNYSLNNPLRFIDPTGMEVISVAGGVKFTGDDARDAYSIIIGRKKNVVIDISAKSGYSDADRRVNYDHWATFTVSNMTLANEMLAVFKEGAIKNLVIGSHGLNVFSDNRHLKKTGFKFKSDDARNERFTFKDVKTYNENGSADGSAGEDVGIRMLQSIMSKVATGGNCIFAVCYLGQSDNNIDIEFAKELSTLSGNRLNLYTYSDFTSIWRYLDGDNIGATSIGGDARLESKLASPSAYWNKIQNGSIVERLKKIILSDSPNPVEFKK